MKTYYLKVVYTPRKGKGKGVSRITKHQTKGPNEKEVRLELLKEYIYNGFRVLKIRRSEKAYG